LRLIAARRPRMRRITASKSTATPSGTRTPNAPALRTSSAARAMRSPDDRREKLPPRRSDTLARFVCAVSEKMLGEIDPNSTDLKLVEQRAALQQQIDWDSHVFDDRQRLLPVVCEQPRVIEQRVFALSRAIQEQLAVTQ